LWEDSLSAHAGDDVTGECFNDSAFDESAVFNDATPDSITLTAASGEEHDGTAGTGVRFVRTATTISIHYNAVVLMHAQLIEIDTNGQATEVAVRIQLAQGSLNRMLVHGSSATGRCEAIRISNATFDLLNTIIYDIATSSATLDVTGLQKTGSVGTMNIMNMTIHDVHATGDATAKGLLATDEAGLTMQNVIVTDTLADNVSTEQDFDITSYSNATVTNNLSSDTTASGTGSLTSKTSANQYKVTTVGSEDLHLKADADAIGTGIDKVVTPTNVNLDIDNINRDALSSLWSIGAHQRRTTASIGTTGRDFSTITLFEADLSTATNFNGNSEAVGECFDDSVFDETVNFNDATPASVTLTVASGEQHDGTEGTGARISVTSSGTIIANLVDNFTIQFLELTQGADVNTSFALNLASGNDKGITARQLIIHDTGRSSGSTKVMGIRAIDTNSQVDIFNNIIYDVYADGTASSEVFGLVIDAGGATSHTYNNTVFRTNSTSSDGASDATNIRYDRDDADMVARNNIAMDASSTNGTANDITWLGIVNIDSDYQMSSDATADDDGGSNSLINKSSSEQFVATLAGSVDLHLKTGSNATDAGVDLGTTPSGVQFDINNFDRTASITWDIGAHELGVAAMVGMVSPRKAFRSLIFEPLWVRVKKRRFRR